jgi:hypothetical protein
LIFHIIQHGKNGARPNHAIVGSEFQPYAGMFRAINPITE